jgi:hypothetical protein
VRLKHQPSAGITARQAGDDIRTAGENLLLPHLNSALLKKAPHITGNLTLSRPAIIGGIDAVDANEIGESLENGGHLEKSTRHERNRGEKSSDTFSPVD